MSASRSEGSDRPKQKTRFKNSKLLLKKTKGLGRSLKKSDTSANQEKSFPSDEETKSCPKSYNGENGDKDIPATTETDASMMQKTSSQNLRKKKPGKAESSCSTESIDVNVKPRKRTAFRVKKHVVSKVGETKIGRSTLIKITGPSGDDLIKNLKLAVTKLDGKEKAKELKKDSLKWILKASVLWKHKDLTAEALESVKEPARLAAEILVEFTRRKEIGTRDIDPIHNQMSHISQKLKNIFTPLSQQKNVEKLCGTINYYGSKRFLNHLLNEKQCGVECQSVANALDKILSSSSRLLNIENDTIRYRYIQNLKNVSFGMCMSGFPEVASSFQRFLEESKLIELCHSFRFLTVEKEYASISSKAVRIQRGKNMFRKYLGESASHKIEIPRSDLEAIQNNLEKGTSTLFSGLGKSLQQELRSVFLNDYLNSSLYKTWMQKLSEEEVRLYSVYGKNWFTAVKEAKN